MLDAPDELTRQTQLDDLVNCKVTAESETTAGRREGEGNAGRVGAVVYSLLQGHPL